MSLGNVGKEAAADAVVALGVYVGPLTGDPFTGSGSEPVGGSPAYARKPTTWLTDTTDDGSRLGTAVILDVPPGVYTHFGLWVAATGSGLIGVGELPEPLTITEQIQVRITPTATGS